ADEALGNSEALRLVPVTRLLQELLERPDVPSPERDVAFLLHAQPLPIPVAREHGLALEQLADLGMVHVLPLVVPVRHDVEQRAKRRARIVDAAVLEVRERDLPLRFD